jgi:hypothetical protein
MKWDRVKPDLNDAPVALCSSCSSIDSIQLLFDPECDLSTLRMISDTCDLHGLLLRSLEREGYIPPRVFTLRQDGALVGIENGPNLLSIYVEPGMWNIRVDSDRTFLNIAFHQAQISHRHN